MSSSTRISGCTTAGSGSTGPTYTGIGSAFICDAWQGWSLLARGNGVLEKHFPDGSSEGGITAAAPLKATKAGPDDGAYLGWANADGTVVIGSTIADGKTRFGIFRDRRFSALPALPGAGAVVPVGVLYGAVAW